mgnify:CR=1 FL=1
MFKKEESAQMLHVEEFINSLERNSLNEEEQAILLVGSGANMEEKNSCVINKIACNPFC